MTSSDASSQGHEAAPEGTDVLAGAPNYSNAQNFLSHMQTGVDPRTGDFTCSFGMPALEANALCGPTVQLGLGFSGQLLDNLGYGIGWALSGLSSFHPASKVISLATGERFVAEYTAGEFTYKDRKLVTFHMRRDTTVTGIYWVTHKSGVIEKLSTLGGVAQIAMPVEIRSPEGRRIYLEYSAEAAPKLRSIRDETRTLLTVTRNGAVNVDITLHPDAAAPVEFRLLLQNGLLSSVMLPENNASWRIQYRMIDGINYVTRVDLPMGGFETVTYQQQGHRCLTGAPKAYLPYVTTHTRTPGQQQPVMSTTYTYDTRNYLGYGTGLQWQPGEDNLYRVVMPAGQQYIYGSTATTQTTVDGQAVVRTVRSEYNRLHLQTLERTTQNGHVLEKVTVFHDDPAVGFAQQKPYFQLPKNATTSWYLAATPGVRRDEVVLTDYDDHGNLIRQVDETGLIEEREYYPAAGGDGCPADPHGFVRSLQTLRAIPMADREAGAAVVETRCRYKTLPSRVAGDPPYLVMTQEEKVALQGGTVIDLGTENTVYVESTADPHFGRIQQTQESLNGKTTSTTYSYTVADMVLTVDTTVTGHDGTRRHGIEKQSLLNGMTVHEEAEEGVAVAYAYDRLGRVTAETASPGTPLAAVRNTTYTLAVMPGDDVYVETRDVAEVRSRVHLDGLGREIRAEDEDVDHAPGTFRQIWTRSYNALGELVEQATTDWVGGVARPRLVTRYAYDHWGQPSRVTHPDGSRTITEANPVSLIEKTWMEDASGIKTSSTVTHSNVFGKPDRIEYFDASGVAHGHASFLYDGIGRCVSETDRLGRETTYVYDAFDRVVETTLPDGAKVTTRFAEHSGDELPVEVSIAHASLGPGLSVGQQAYDGLSRRVSSTVGGRTTRFDYEAGGLLPETQTTPLNEVIKYTYEPQLGMQLVGRTDTSASTFRYDPKRAQLTYAGRDGLEKTMEYYKSGLISIERWKNGSGVERMARYTHSLAGRSQSYTDVFGVEQIVTYDALDRPEELKYQGVVTKLGYDGFSRVTSIRAWQGLQSMQTTIAFDDFGREASRNFTASAIGGETVSQVLTMYYTQGDQLDRRTLEQGAVMVRDEGFEYDARGRLTLYTCSGTQVPRDPWGKPINRQQFDFDAFDRIKSITTHFPGGVNEARYIYEETDPAQLSRVVHSHADYPKDLQGLQWDGAGRAVRDERGRTLVWNAQNQLIEISAPAAVV